MVSSILLKELEIDSTASSALAGDYERFAEGLPEALEEYVRDRYAINLSSEYGGLPIKNPFGKRLVSCLSMYLRWPMTRKLVSGSSSSKQSSPKMSTALSP